MRSFYASWGFAFLLQSSALAATINVPADQPRIQAAINVAVNGDEVVVAHGTYDEIIDFRAKAITVRSSGGAAVTIIDATNVDDLGFGKPVVRCDCGEGPNSVLDGFTVTGGIGDSTLFGSAQVGGGMFINNASSPTVMNCTFDGNSVTDQGGGMYVDNASSPTVTGCTFSGNTADGGGGMYVTNGSNPTVDNCTFGGNTASINGGGMFIIDSSSSMTVANCMFTGNSAVDGAGIYTPNGNPTVSNCAFITNNASDDGGGMHIAGPIPNATVAGCLFSGNTAIDLGGGIFNAAGSAVINCTFVENAGQGDGLYNSSPPSVLTVTNCIFWMDGISGIGGGFIAVTYSIIGGGFTGNGNIDTDPLFVDAPGGDFRLMAGSPCIDAGDSNAAASAGLQTDLDGNDRGVNDPVTAETGLPVLGVVVDMGAHEFQPGPPGSPSVGSQADLDDDGDVDINDFLTFSNCFNGALNPPKCP